MDTEAITLLIHDLAAEGIQLHVDDGVLRHRAPSDALTPERRALLDLHHDAIRDVVRARSYVGARPPHVPEAQAVWAPTSVQASVLESSWTNIMGDVRPVPVLDLAAAQAALDEVIARHDALRTRFTKDQEGRYWAVTERRLKVSIEHVDVSALSTDARIARLLEFAPTMFNTPFDPEVGPLLRMVLIRVGEREMYSMVAMCHSIFDRISWDVFYRELLVLHYAFRSGTAPALGPAPQFRDYAQQLNDRINGDVGYNDFIYCRNRVLGRTLDFPTSVLLKAGAEITGAGIAPSAQPATSLIRFRGIDEQQIASLRNLARRERLTPFACALAAVGVALRSCARSQDAFVWVVQSARITPEMAGLIGCCAIHSYFPMRFSNEQTLRETLRAVWHTYLEDMRHLLPAQSLSPLFARAFASGVFLGVEFNYLLSDPLAASGHTSGANGGPTNLNMPVEEDGSMFLIRVCFYESERGLAWSVRYKSALLEDELVERLSILIGEILVQMTQDVDIRLNGMNC